VSNVEVNPALVERGGRGEISARPVHDLIPGRIAHLGPGTDVRRLLPTLGRRLVGAWCFLDHYGPDDVAVGTTAGMQVPPHPHTGLQTVSWLFEGAVHHRDSLGNDATFGPGQLGLMTAGHGIAHAEQSPVPRPELLHGTQLWVALPDRARDGAPAWDFHADLPQLDLDGARLRVMVGDFGGLSSPAPTFSPIVGLDLTIAGPRSIELDLEPDFEYAAICVDGSARADGVDVPIGSLLYLGAGRRSLAVAADNPAHLMLLGGEPFEEHIVMWWNFVGRSHEEIELFRTSWQEQQRFGEVAGWDGQRLEAPPLPATRLKPRR
jgi:redox-sensitive bicupin YhaK (pirin superfamily)